MVSYFLRYFSSTSTEQISPIPPDLSPVSIRLALLFLLLTRGALGRTANAAGTEALMIFQGPEGYITPNWYASKTVHGKVVPTWNYADVHACGRPEVMNEKDWLQLWRYLHV